MPVAVPAWRLEGARSPSETDTRMAAYQGQHIASKWEWLDALRPRRLGGGNFKAVAMALGSHANKDGTNARPGILRLAYETETSRRTAARAIRHLEALGASSASSGAPPMAAGAGQATTPSPFTTTSACSASPTRSG